MNIDERLKFTDIMGFPNVVFNERLIQGEGRERWERIRRKGSNS